MGKAPVPTNTAKNPRKPVKQHIPVTGRVVVITGADTGVRAAPAHRVATGGYTVVLDGRTPAVDGVIGPHRQAKLHKIGNRPFRQEGGTA
jgi:NAD(P)-dependent dehydrogenase (short-subunit alcohol dehydrogenase family)